MGVINKSLCILLLLLLTLGISGCNGGGGGGGGSSSSSTSAQALVYTGNTNPAVITTDNSKTLAANVIGSSGTGLIVAAGIVAEQQPTLSPDLVQLGPRLSSDLRTTLNRVASNLRSGAQSIVGVSVDETVPCDLSGTVSVSGSLDDATGTGTLNLTFNSCNDIDGWLNGQTTFRIDAYDAANDFFTDTTIGFTALQVKDTNYDVSLSGSLRSQVAISSNREQLSGSYVARDNTSGELAKLENLSVIVDYNSVLNPSSYNLSVASGRVFDSVAGYVDIATTAPWFYATLAQDFPTSGGALVLTGANNVHISVTPASSTLVTVELDLDANGVYELASTMPWTFLAGTLPTTNTAPTANAGADQTVPKGTQVTLDGSGSSDPKYDFLTYQWTLAQKPNGSQAQLGGTTSIHPTFTPDLEGNYVINLAVSDGKLSSGTSTVTITVTNTAPVANAGPNQYTTVGTQVTLDGTASSDPNGDTISYSWNFSARPSGSNASLINPTNAKPVFTPDVAGLYELQLIVNDGKLNSTAATVRVAAVSAASNLCTSDDITGIPSSGSIAVGPSQDFVPLCSGWILIGNRATNAVIYTNVFTGQTNTSYLLTSSPGDLELDSDNNLLYVALNPVTQLSKINLQTNQVSYISLSAPALTMAHGNNGQIFAVLDSVVWYDRPIVLINGLTQTVEKTYPNTNIYSYFVVFDRAHNKLISAPWGASPSSLYRHAFNPIDLTLALEENKWGTGGNGQGLAISPDGNHIAYPNGGGNGNGYTIYDYSSGNFGVVYGEWNTDAYPRSAEFDPFGKYLVATNTFDIKVFDIATHVMVKQYTVDLAGCTYPDLNRVGFSRGGKIVYAYANCGFDKSSGKLFWAVFNP